MDLNFSEQELAFRDQVRSFLERKLPHRLRDKMRGGIRLLKSDMDEWQALRSVSTECTKSASGTPSVRPRTMRVW